MWCVSKYRTMSLSLPYKESWNIQIQKLLLCWMKCEVFKSKSHSIWNFKYPTIKCSGYAKPDINKKQGHPSKTHVFLINLLLQLLYLETDLHSPFSTEIQVLLSTNYSPWVLPIYKRELQFLSDISELFLVRDWKCSRRHRIGVKKDKASSFH